MKRFIAVFGVIVIITMHCLSFYPAKAAINGVDYGEMLNTYLGAAEAALATSQGVSIDWSNLELPEGSDTWTDHQKAEYVVSWLGAYKKLGLKAIYDFLFPDNPNYTGSVISSETAAIVLSNNSNINTQDIKAQLDNILATQSQDHVFQRYTDKVIARWNEYNTNYINDYLIDMTPVSDNPIVNPDQNYLDEIDFINGTTFDNFMDSSKILDTSSGYASMLYFNRAMSYYTPLSNYSDGIFGEILVSDIFDINIVSYNDTYAFYKELSFFPNFIIGSNPNYGYLGKRINNFNANDRISYTYWCGWSDTGYASKTVNYNGTLQQVFDYLKLHFHNINIYVDGILWASAGSNITSGLGFDVPDAVIDNSTDDGKIVAHPIYYPDVMNTDKAIDIDLDKVIDAIASRIAQGADDISFDDLVDAGAAVKIDGTTLTDADTVVKDVSVPIARAKVDTIDGVVPTIDVVPPLPPLPPLTPGDYSGEGFNGMSVLARIINATVQGLPEPLILTFFGVVFGAVILGIIKILHH